VLYLLACHPNQVFMNQPPNKVRDIDFEGDTTTTWNYIRRRVLEIEANPLEPHFIRTVWGIGYKFTD